MFANKSHLSKDPKCLEYVSMWLLQLTKKNWSASLKLNSVSSFWFSRHWNKGMQVELEGRPWPCNGIRSLLSRHHCHAQHMLLSCCFYRYHQSYRQNITMIINNTITTSCRHNSVSVFLDLISLGDLSIGAKHHLHYHLPSYQHEKASHSHHSLWPTIIRPSLYEDCFPMASTSLPRSVVLWPLYFCPGAQSLDILIFAVQAFFLAAHEPCHLI